jgi:hypothetical protein
VSLWGRINQFGHKFGYAFSDFHLKRMTIMAYIQVPAVATQRNLPKYPKAATGKRRYEKSLLVSD